MLEFTRMLPHKVQVYSVRDHSQTTLTCLSGDVMLLLQDDHGCFGIYSSRPQIHCRVWFQIGLFMAQRHPCRSAE